MKAILIFSMSFLISTFVSANDINIYKSGITFPYINVNEFGNNHFLNNGAIGNVQAINKIEVGMDKEQVKLLLGLPHFVTGIFGVHTWNYVFKFKGSNGVDLSCQYQIDFDDDMLVSDSYFNNQVCADYHNSFS